MYMYIVCIHSYTCFMHGNFADINLPESQQSKWEFDFKHRT